MQKENYNVSYRIRLPCWKLRRFSKIEEKLGRVLITSIHDTYVIDDKNLKGSFAERRLQLLKSKKYPIYPLKEKVNLLRTLIKYPTGTNFIDSDGYIFEYRKGNKLYWVESKKIQSFNKVDNKTVFYVDKQRIPYITDLNLDYIPYASLMYTDFGPLIYDFTTEYHDPYKRKL